MDWRRPIIVMRCPPRNPDYSKYGIITPIIVEDRDGRAGNLRVAIRALEEGLSYGGPVTIVQDDLVFCQNFEAYIARYMQRIERERMIVQWFRPDKYYDSFIKPCGLMPNSRDLHPKRFCYTQAVTYPSYWATRIHGFLKAVPVLDSVGPVQGDDFWIAEALAAYNADYHVHYPNIVQHVGTVSLATPNRRVPFPVAKDFVGEDFDPLQWPANS
jgi:hypothetical protein